MEQQPIMSTLPTMFNTVQSGCSNLLGVYILFEYLLYLCFLQRFVPVIVLPIYMYAQTLERYHLMVQSQMYISERVYGKTFVGLHCRSI